MFDIMRKVQLNVFLVKGKVEECEKGFIYNTVLSI